MSKFWFTCDEKLLPKYLKLKKNFTDSLERIIKKSVISGNGIFLDQIQ